MAEENEGKKEGETTAESAAAPSASSKKTIVLAVGGLVLLLVAIGVPVTMMLTQKEKGAEALSEDAAQEAALTIEGAQDEDELDEGEAALGGIFPLETFVVNLQGGRFIRAQVQLEFTSREIPKRFYSKMVLVRDAIISMLAKRTADDALSEKGRTSLKSEIRETVNEILKKEDIKTVYFTQFIVQ